jgi:hypothetical protein
MNSYAFLSEKPLYQVEQWSVASCQWAVEAGGGQQKHQMIQWFF